MSKSEVETQIQKQIQFRDIEESDFVYNDIMAHIEKLERICPDIMSCHVTVAAPHRHHHQGIIYHIQIRLHLAGADIFVNTEPEKNNAHEDAYIAIRDAFLAATRQVEDFIRRRREPLDMERFEHHGKVAKLFAGEGYGFLRTFDGRDVYFHENSVLKGKFAELEIGDEVRFDEEMGEKGPQATSLQKVGKSGHAGINPAKG